MARRAKQPTLAALAAAMPDRVPSAAEWKLLAQIAPPGASDEVPTLTRTANRPFAPVYALPGVLANVPEAGIIRLVEMGWIVGKPVDRWWDHVRFRLTTAGVAALARGAAAHDGAAKRGGRRGAR